MPPPPDHDWETFALVVYWMGVVILGIGIAIASCQRVQAPWVPGPFYTDGVLMWFLPVATAVPILLWPASLVAWLIVITYRRASKAERFCGISRGRLQRRYRELRGGWWRGGYRPVDVEQPHEDAGVSAELLVVASSSTGDEACPESPAARQPLISTGDKNMHDGHAPTSPTRGSDEESGPPVYEP